MNAFGEELMIHHLEDAVSIAIDKTEAKINEFTVCPEIGYNKSSLGFHHWVFEFNKTPINIEEFKTILEKELQKNNIDYFNKRLNNQPIAPPKISIVKKGTFNFWMKKRGKFGGQHKVPRIYESNQYVKELLELGKTN